MDVAKVNEHLDVYSSHIRQTIASPKRARPRGIRYYVSMSENTGGTALLDFGKRIQRCYGCFIAYHLKDMYLGEDVTFFCENCRDETMFHFDDFSKLMDVSKLNSPDEEHHHH